MNKLSIENKYTIMKYKYLKLKNQIAGNPYGDMVKGNTSKLIGTGSYGCVYSPPLKCDHTQCSDKRCLTGISKLMNYSDADKELKAYKNINVDEIDKDMFFHIGAPHLCIPKVMDIPNLEKCSFINKPFGLLIYENGGDNFLNLLKKIIEKPNDFKTYNSNKFMHQIKKILLGLKIFHEHRIAHFDIKLDNIVTGVNDLTNLDNLNFRLIDFGLSFNYNCKLVIEEIFNKLNGMEYDLLQYHFKKSGFIFSYFPVDLYLLSFLKDKTLTVNDFRELRKYIKKYVKDLNKTYPYLYLNNLYTTREFSNNNIYVGLIKLIKYKPFDKIIFRIIQTVESFQIGVILVELMSYFPEYNQVLSKFLDKTKILHYNPFERMPVGQLYDEFNKLI